MFTHIVWRVFLLKDYDKIRTPPGFTLLLNKAQLRNICIYM